MKTLQLGCPALDRLLGGGLQSGMITKVFGEAGTGKSNLCLQASRECAALGYQVAFIDSEGVSIERFRQLCTDRNWDKILEKMRFFRPQSLEEQEKKIKEALKVNHLGLIAVDTMNLLYRVKLEDDPDAAMRIFLRQMTALQVAAREQDLYVLVAEQVYTDEKGVVQPFTHRETEPLVGTVIRLEKAGEGVRRANLLKQRSRSVEKSAVFRIGPVCLE